MYDTNSGVTYDSIAAATRETGCNSKEIKYDCKRFHDNKKISPRFIYFDDMIQHIGQVKEG